MLATQIKKFLEDFYLDEDNKMKSVLFDGQQGCGKTHGLEDFINNKDDGTINPSYIYFSLFGVNSIRQIVLRLAEKLDSTFVRNVDGNYFLTSSMEQRPYNKSVIIFDDLERKGKKLSFESMLGLIDSLRSLGFKIVCASSSAKITEKKSFQDFKDKSFDTVISVEADAKLFPTIINKLNIPLDESYLKRADDNWRLLLKTQDHCVAIGKYMENEKKADYLAKMRLNLSSLFRCVLIAIKCIFFTDSDRIRPDFKEDNLKKARFFEETYGFKKYIAKGWYKTFYVDGENHELKEQVKLLISAISENDYQAIVDYYYPKTEADILNQYPFNQEPFFLSDTGKKSFKKAFFEQLNHFDFRLDFHSRFLARFLNVFANRMTKGEIDALVEKITNNIPFDQSDDFLKRLFITVSEEPEKFGSFRKLLKERFRLIGKLTDASLLEQAFAKKDYSYLTNYLYQNAQNQNIEINDSIAELFRQHENYFLPDLSKKINYQSWEYCHEIAKFVSSLENHKSLFIECLKEQCEKSNSKTLRERCEALVKYNFSERIDFFELCPIKK